MNAQLDTSIRADVVGSLLRPEFLLEMQEKVRKGQATQAQLTQAEDVAIKAAVKLQEQAGVDVVTDGEMRRPVFCHNFVKAVDGFKWNIPGNSVIWFDMQGKKQIDPVTVGVTRKLQKKHDISVDEFAFLRAVTDKPKKITIPSPTMMSYYFVSGISNTAYKSPLAFLKEVARILKESVIELENQGVSYLQIDAPEFGMLLDPIQQKWFAQKGFNPRQLVAQGVQLLNEVLDGFSGTTALHICRGNDKNRFMAKGGYEAIAETIFKRVRVDRLLLEFDSDRAGDFSPLRFVPEDKTVVLGLITTKSPQLESKTAVIKRIKEATRFVPLERLAVSTQCGFASVAKGNHLSASDQAAKLKLVVAVAKQVWKSS